MKDILPAYRVADTQICRPPHHHCIRNDVTQSVDTAVLLSRSLDCAYIHAAIDRTAASLPTAQTPSSTAITPSTAITSLTATTAATPSSTTLTPTEYSSCRKVAYRLLKERAQTLRSPRHKQRISLTRQVSVQYSGLSSPAGISAGTATGTSTTSTILTGTADITVGHRYEVAIAITRPSGVDRASSTFVGSRQQNNSRDAGPRLGSCDE